MQRFRLLGFYVAGVVAMVGLAIGAVSMRRSSAETETPGSRGSITLPTQSTTNGIERGQERNSTAPYSRGRRQVLG
jgi:hypothetical protein